MRYISLSPPEFQRDLSCGRSIRTTSEFSRRRSKTICLPSGVISNVRIAAGSVKLVKGRLFIVTRGKTERIRSIELNYTGPTRKATLPLQP
jgi:hypothetical protein